MKVQDREFEFLVASNLEPDEMNLELWELRGGKRVMVAEVSYAESDGNDVWLAPSVDWTPEQVFADGVRRAPRTARRTDQASARRTVPTNRPNPRSTTV